jgi:hypothetical protein
MRRTFFLENLAIVDRQITRNFAIQKITHIYKLKGIETNGTNLGNRCKIEGTSGFACTSAGTSKTGQDLHL